MRGIRIILAFRRSSLTQSQPVAVELTDAFFLNGSFECASNSLNIGISQAQILQRKRK